MFVTKSMLTAHDQNICSSLVKKTTMDLINKYLLKYSL